MVLILLGVTNYQNCTGTFCLKQYTIQHFVIYMAVLVLNFQSTRKFSYLGLCQRQTSLDPSFKVYCHQCCLQEELCKIEFCIQYSVQYEFQFFYDPFPFW